MTITRLLQPLYRSRFAHVSIGKWVYICSFHTVDYSQRIIREVTIWVPCERWIASSYTTLARDFYFLLINRVLYVLTFRGKCQNDHDPEGIKKSSIEKKDKTNSHRLVEEQTLRYGFAFYDGFSPGYFLNSRFLFILGFHLVLGFMFLSGLGITQVSITLFSCCTVFNQLLGFGYSS